MSEENRQSIYTNDDKMRWEVEKLRAETYNLRLPYLKTPSSWITIMTVILALFGVTVQYFKSDREYQLAEIKRQQTELETRQIEADRQQLLESISHAKDSLARLQSQREEATNTLMSLQSKTRDLGNKVANIASEGATNEIRQVVQDVNKSVDRLTVLNEKASNQSEETTENLQALSTDLVARRSPAFAVIASHVKLEDAIAQARELKEKNFSFPIEVYKGPNPTRYRVTLGGYLTPEEASKRVEYAKQQGIAQDAYVRFSQGWGENLFE